MTISVLPSLPPATNRAAAGHYHRDRSYCHRGATNDFVWPGETNSPPTWAAWPAAASQFFTNYGPKTATFTVRRQGETNDGLTVPYGIGGTASNGVDYAAIPGFVTIPSGGDAARW